MEFIPIVSIVVIVLVTLTGATSSYPDDPCEDLPSASPSSSLYPDASSALDYCEFGAICDDIDEFADHCARTIKEHLQSEIDIADYDVDESIAMIVYQEKMKLPNLKNRMDWWDQTGRLETYSRVKEMMVDIYQEIVRIYDFEDICSDFDHIFKECMELINQHRNSTLESRQIWDGCFGDGELGRLITEISDRDMLYQYNYEKDLTDWWNGEGRRYVHDYYITMAKDIIEMVEKEMARMKVIEWVQMTPEI